MNKVQQKFEEFAESRGFDPNHYFSRGIHPNYYDHDTINEMWISWKVSRGDIVVKLPRCWNDEQRDYRDELVDTLDDLGVKYE